MTARGGSDDLAWLTQQRTEGLDGLLGVRALGTQPQEDNVFRQGFLFEEPGDYVIAAAFLADGAAYTLDFPLRIGEPTPVGPIGVAVGLLLTLLVGVSVMQRRRAMTGKIRGAQEARTQEARAHEAPE